MKRIKIFLSITLLSMLILGTSCHLKAQDRSKKFDTFSDRLFFGGSIGMYFGNVTQIDILPEVGLWIVPQWSVGLGGRYTFRKIGSGGYKSHIWGVSGFTQIMPIPDFDKTFHIGIKGGIILYGEWEALYLNKGLIDPNATVPKGNGWVKMYLVGGGYHVPLGDRAALNILALWDLTNNTYSPYTSNPILRLSISF